MAFLAATAATAAAVAVTAWWLNYMDISVNLRVVPYEAELVWVGGGVDHDATTQQRLTVLSGDRKPYDVVFVHRTLRPGSRRAMACIGLTIGCVSAHVARVCVTPHVLCVHKTVEALSSAPSIAWFVAFLPYMPHRVHSWAARHPPAPK